MFKTTVLACIVRAALFGALALVSVSSAFGQSLQYPKDCVAGKRVSTNTGRKGTVTRLDTAWSYCYVRFDDNGKEEGYLYSLLNSEGGLDPKDRTLAVGTYECVTSGAGGSTILAGTMRITGADSYVFGGSAPGRYHVEASGKIVFDTGPLKPYFSKLLSGGRIGLNANGDKFYATSCELNRNIR